MSAPRRFLFTLTAGRTGTASLAKLFEINFPAAESHHEIIGWDRFGLDSPDLSTMTLFNSQGNLPAVREFWARKFARVAASPSALYVETSHVLMKAGLLENLDLLLAAVEGPAELHFVDLQRDLFDTVLSYRSRFDFTNKSMWWLWYLDPTYPRNIVDFGKLADFGLNGVCLWYLFEVRARAAYYRQLFAARPGVVFHRLDLTALQDEAAMTAFLSAVSGHALPKPCRLPERQNLGQNKPSFAPKEVELLRRMASEIRFDPEATARDYIDQGRRL
ncbi:MAG TPA: hypothetical protein VKN76_13995 [Kiloniellaceae bacterium]|nr:hypothetical protein [Kiloniellaceae bacterium]